MLTESQVRFVDFISWAACRGLVVGAFFAVIFGAVCRVFKTHKPVDVFVGISLGVIPGALAASLIDASFAATEGVVFEPSQGKGWGYLSPGWFEWVQWCIEIAMAVGVSRLFARHEQTPEKRKDTVRQILFWGVAGGAMTSLASIDFAKPWTRWELAVDPGAVSSAARGFVIGSLITALWRFGVAIWLNFQTPVSAARRSVMARFLRNRWTISLGGLGAVLVLFYWVNREPTAGILYNNPNVMDSSWTDRDFESIYGSPGRLVKGDISSPEGYEKEWRGRGDIITIRFKRDGSFDGGKIEDYEMGILEEVQYELGL